MALDIVKLYISFIAEFFELSDVEITSPTGPENHPSFLPKTSNSITMAHFLIKLLGEIQETISEVGALEISSEVNTKIKSFLESARRGFQETLIHAWKRGRVSPLLGGNQSPLPPSIQMPTFSTTWRTGRATPTNLQLPCILARYKPSSGT